MHRRHSRARMEDVAVAAPVDLEEALVVATGGHRRIRELQRRDQFAADARVPDADTPLCSVGPKAHRTHVTAEVRESVLDPAFGADRRDTVRRVFLADPAEIDFHAGARQSNRTFVPLNLAPID